MDSEVVRGKPLTKDKTKLLLGLIESSPIILSKMADSASNEMKTEEWVCLTRKFNATATGDDNGGDSVLAGQAKVLPLESIPVSVETGMGTSIPVSISNDIGIVVPISVSTTPFNTSIPLSIVNGTSTLIPETVDNVIEVNECQLAAGQSPIRTPKKLTLSMPRIGRKKLKTSDGSSSVRNLAIAEYYTAKKQLLDAKKEYILLQSEKLKIEIEKLRNN